MVSSVTPQSMNNIVGSSLAGHCGVEEDTSVTDYTQMSLVPYRQTKRTVPVPREVISTSEMNDLLMKAAMRAVQQKSSGVREIKDIVLHPIRVAEHRAFSNRASPPGSPLKGTLDLQLRAHAVNQVMIRDFYSGARGEYLKEWVRSLYIVSDWLWESYREGAAPELVPIESIPQRKQIPYTPEAADFHAASVSMRDTIYKTHLQADPYQPFERYSVKSVHSYFEEGSSEEMMSIRVKRQPGASQTTTQTMEHFMRMLQLEAQHGVLDPHSTDENPVEPSLLAGIWALSSLHDNFSQDPNALDDPSFWLLQLLNHSLSRNHCYQKMTPGKREHPHLCMPTAPALAHFQARNRPAIRSSIELKYQRMFRALHLMVVQKVCLVLRTRFKRLHNIEPTKTNKVDPTAFNKAAGFHKAHLNEAEESWRKNTNSGPQELLMLQQQQQLLITCSEETRKEDHGEAGVVKLARETEKIKLATVFLQRTDLTAPVCTTVAALVNDERVLKAKEVLFHRVNDIDQSIALHGIYTDFICLNYDADRLHYGETQDRILEQMREAWKQGDGQVVSNLSAKFTQCGRSAVHMNTGSGRAAFLRAVLEGKASLNIFAHHSSFYGQNEAIYGCSVPRDWCTEAGAKPTLVSGGDTLQQMAEKMFPRNGGGLGEASVYGPDGKWAMERGVLLKLLKELQDVLSSTHVNRVVHLPMLLVCSKKWVHESKSLSIGESELEQVCEYIASKERARSEMEYCLTAMHDQMHHVVEAAFRFVLLRSLPGRADSSVLDRRPLPMRPSDDRVAHVARAHLYLMLSIAKNRDMKTVYGEPIFFIADDGLEMSNPRLWSENDWVGFAMITDVALSAEGGRLGREQASVSLPALPSHMISQHGIVEVPLHSQDAGPVIQLMTSCAEKRFGKAPAASFLDFGPSFSGQRCTQLLSLNWNAYKYLRTNAKADDITRLSRTNPWKGCDVHIATAERRSATAFFVRECEMFTQKGSQLVAKGTALPPLTHKDTMGEEELFGVSDSDDAEEEHHNVKARRLL